MRHLGNKCLKAPIQTGSTIVLDFHHSDLFGRHGYLGSVSRRQWKSPERQNRKTNQFDGPLRVQKYCINECSFVGASQKWPGNSNAGNGILLVPLAILHSNVLLCEFNIKFVINGQFICKLKIKHKHVPTDVSYKNTFTGTQFGFKN